MSINRGRGKQRSGGDTYLQHLSKSLYAHLLVLSVTEVDPDWEKSQSFLHFRINRVLIKR